MESENIEESVLELPLSCKSVKEKIERELRKEDEHEIDKHEKPGS